MIRMSESARVMPNRSLTSVTITFLIKLFAWVTVRVEGNGIGMDSKLSIVSPVFRTEVQWTSILLPDDRSSMNVMVFAIVL